MSDVLGLGSMIGSIYGSHVSAKAQEKAADTEAEAARYAADLQQRQYETSRADYGPYSQLGAVASPLLQYLVTGIMPTLSPQEQQQIDRYNLAVANLGGEGVGGIGAEGTVPSATGATGQGMLPLPPEAGSMGWYDPETGELKLYQGLDGYWRNPDGSYFGGVRDPSWVERPFGTDVVAQAEAKRILKEEVDPYYLGNALSRQQAIGAIQGGQGGIQASPLYQWQQEQLNKQINRQLQARGRSNSTFGVNALGEAQRALGAEETERQYGRLLDLTNIGRGATGSVSSLGSMSATGAGNAMMQAGAAQAQGIAGAGATRGSMWANAAATPMNMYYTQQYIDALRGNQQQPQQQPQWTVPSNTWQQQQQQAGYYSGA